MAAKLVIFYHSAKFFSKKLYKASHNSNLPQLKVGFHRKQELVDEYLLERGDIVLLIEHQHGLLVIFLSLLSYRKPLIGTKILLFCRKSGQVVPIFKFI